MKRTLLISLLFFTALSFSQAQSLKIGLGGGYTTFNGAEYFVNDISDGGLGFNDAFHYGGIVKAGLPLLPLTFTGSLYYTKFSNEGSVQQNGNVATLETDGSLTTIGLGAEWGLVPGPISPYLALDVLITTFGDYEITRADDLANMTNNVDGNTRYGLGIGAGVGFTLIPKLDLDLSMKYKFHNLIGKDDNVGLADTLLGQTEEESINSLNITLNVMFNIL